MSLILGRLTCAVGDALALTWIQVGLRDADAVDSIVVLARTVCEMVPILFMEFPLTSSLAVWLSTG